jgi:hypothetical protein
MPPRTSSLAGSAGKLGGINSAMRFSELTEAPRVYFDVPDLSVNDGMMELWELHTPDDLAYALNNTKSKGELRGLLSDEMLIAWDSHREVHGGVIDELRSYDDEEYPGDEKNQDWQAQIYLYADRVAMAPKRAGDPRYVIRHPLIQAIYRHKAHLGAIRPGSA